MAGTNVSYNGVNLINVLTREFVQTGVDDKSGTDRIGYHYKVSVETIINVTAATVPFGVSGVAAPGTTTAELEQYVRDLLLQKRQEFLYVVDGKTLIDVSAANDLKNGPNPLSVSLSHITAATFRIVFTIEFVMSDCIAATSGQVLSNRWSSSDDLDEHFRITRRWQGVLRIDSGAYNAHAFRGLCVPTLQQGYRRKSMHFIVDPSGLELGYKIIDEQMLGDAAPYPATHWKYTHTEKLLFTGMKNTGSLSIHLFGFPRANKNSMLAFAMQMINVKLMPNALNMPKVIMTNMTVVDHGGDADCRLDVLAEVSRVPLKGTTTSTTAPPNSPLAFTIGSLGLNNFGTSVGALSIPHYNANQVVYFGPTGTNDPATLAGIFACYLQDQCTSGHAMPQGGVPLGGTGGSGGTSTTSTTTSTTTTTTTTTPTTINPSGDGPYADDAADATTVSAELGDPTAVEIDLPEESAAHLEEMYNHVKLESRWELTAMFLGLPIARASTDSGTATQAFIQLSRGVAKRIIRYEAERVGAWPMIWNPALAGFTDAQGIEYKLEACTPIFQAPMQTGDGKTYYSVDAEYVLLASRQPAATEPIATVSLPWDNFTAADVAYPADTLTDLDDEDFGFV